MLDYSEIKKLKHLRHELHQNPELSGEEVNTAARVVEFLTPLSPDQILTKISHSAVIAIYEGENPDGPTLMFRCELDALPIFETTNITYRSNSLGVAHSCGHDGHMAIICGLAISLHRQRPKCGRVILLFQPAEETGKGAKPLIEALKLNKLIPDYSFAMHNYPKMPLNEIGVKDGYFNCASVGMKIDLLGKTSHASHPENGISPADAMCDILAEIKNINSEFTQFDAYSSITVSHASLGEETFGISAGHSKIMLCLRSEDDGLLTKLKNKLDLYVQKTTSKYGLGYEISYDEAFDASVNDKQASDEIRRACAGENLALVEVENAWRASEDFGQYANISKSAMFLLGSGLEQPQLHNPDFNFPDELIETGHKVFDRIIHNLLG